VPRKVNQLFMAQLFHDRKQREERVTTPAASEETSPTSTTCDPLSPMPTPDTAV
jgi:Isocitrate lyase family.